MSFAARQRSGVSTAGPVNPMGALTVSDIRVSSTTSASINFNTDGTITFTGNASSPTSAWYSPTTAGIGSSYWFRANLTGGDAWLAGLVSGTIYALSSARSLVWSASAGLTKNATVSTFIYSDAGGTQTVATGTLVVTLSGV